MNKIEELMSIEDVQWKALGDICKFERGTTITKKEAVTGRIPVVASGQKPAYYHNESNRPANTITVSSSGAYAGFVNFWREPIYLSDAFSITPVTNMNKRYLYHWLLSNQCVIYGLQQGKSQKHVYGKHMAKLMIPIPNRTIQNEIVKILDKFTDYVNELKAELKDRVNQYAYYRDYLLSEEVLNKLTLKMEYPRQVKTVKLRDIAVIKNGSDWKKLETGTVPVYGSGGFMGKYVDESAYDSPTVLIPRKGTIDNVFYLDQPFWNVDTIYYTDIDSEKIIPKYFYYYMQNYDLNSLSTNPTRPSLTQAVLNRIDIPLPDLKIQEMVVEILDNFQSVIEDTKGLLPEEIEQRQKQYEYYRDKLLTFEPGYSSK